MSDFVPPQDPRLGWASDMAAEMLRRVGLKYISLVPDYRRDRWVVPGPAEAVLVPQDAVVVAVPGKGRILSPINEGWRGHGSLEPVLGHARSFSLRPLSSLQ